MSPRSSRIVIVLFSGLVILASANSKFPKRYGIDKPPPEAAPDVLQSPRQQQVPETPSANTNAEFMDHASKFAESLVDSLLEMFQDDRPSSVVGSAEGEAKTKEVVEHLVHVLGGRSVDKSSALERSLGSLTVPEPWTLLADINANHVHGKDCRRDVESVQQHVSNGTLWAMQMWESGAHSPVGWLRGNVHQLGDYDECVFVKGPITTQYCLATLRIDQKDSKEINSLEPDPYMDAFDRLMDSGRTTGLSLQSVRWGVCAPQSCSPQDIAKGLSANMPAWIKAEVDPEDCSNSTRSKSLDTNDAAFITTCVILVLLVVLATSIDCASANSKEQQQPAISGCQTPGICWRLLRAFSIKRNWYLLGMPNSDDGGGTGDSGIPLGFINIIRFIALYLIIMDHRMLEFLRGPFMDYDDVAKMSREVSSAPVTVGTLVVDLFFVIGGLLLAVGQLSRTESNPLRAIILRYFRLTPPYAIVIWFLASVYFKLGSGPVWNKMAGYEREACQNAWWINLLYINNYFPSDKLSWYLSCDIHLHVLGSALLLPLLRRRRSWGWIALIGSLLLASLAPFLHTFLSKGPALFLFLPRQLQAADMEAEFRHSYSNTHLRAPPYLLGVALGVGLVDIANGSKPPKLTGLQSAVYCLVGLSIMLGDMMVGTMYYDRTRPYRVWEAAAYSAFHRIVWAFGLCILLASLALRQLAPAPAVPVSDSASNKKGLILFGRLCYGVYLVHLAVQVANMAARRTPDFLIKFRVVFDPMSDLAFSLIVSVLMFFAVEEPFRHIAREVFKPKTKPSKALAKHGVSETALSELSLERA